MGTPILSLPLPSLTLHRKEDKPLGFYMVTLKGGMCVCVIGDD